MTGAALLTAAAVAVGVVAPGAGSSTDPAEEAPALAGASTSIGGALQAISDSADEERTIGTSRSVDRVPAVQVQARTPKVEAKRWTYAPLKLRVAPREGARDVGTFPEDKRIGITGTRKAGYAEVVVDQRARWVSAEYLNKKRQPPPEETSGDDASSGDSSADAGSSSSSSSGVDTGSCPNGAVASGGLQPQAQSVMNAVCNAFPEIQSYGGYAPRGEHGGGLAVDVMVTGSLGDQVAQFLYANRGELGLSNIIWAQTIWSAERDGEGFRGMEDRGSTTANHYDHVHVLAG